MSAMKVQLVMDQHRPTSCRAAIGQESHVAAKRQGWHLRNVLLCNAMGEQKLQVGPHGAFQLMLKDARALDQQLAHFLIIQPYLIL